MAGTQLTQNEIGARDVPVIDIARDQAELVATWHRADANLEGDQIGVRHQPAQQFERIRLGCKLERNFAPRAYFEQLCHRCWLGYATG